MLLEKGKKCAEIYRIEAGIFAVNCIECNAIFQEISDALKHVEIHFGETSLESTSFKFETILEIETCDDNFDSLKSEDSLSDYYEYVEESHGMRDPLTCSFNLNSPELKGFTVDTNVFKDQDESSKAKHLSTESNHDENEIQAALDKLTRRGDFSTNPQMYKKCGICNKMLHKRSLQTHINNVHYKLQNPKAEDMKTSARADIGSRKNDFTDCTICGRMIHARSLKTHITNVHMKLKAKAQLSKICQICGKKLSSSSSLKMHLSTHGARKEFKCDICGAEFHVKVNLKTHMVKHTKERPFKCKLCGKAFSQSSYINIHMRDHTGERPYNCTLCGKRFRSKGFLTRHIKDNHQEKDRRFKCNLCDRSYYLKTLYDEHERTHTGEKPFKCAICDKSFNRRNSYKQHILLHSGKKMYKCQYCSMSFAQFAGKASHENIIHKTKAMVKSDFIPFDHIK